MLNRHLTPQLIDALTYAPAVVLLGPRQAGKTTLALEIGAEEVHSWDAARQGQAQKELARLEAWQRSYAKTADDWLWAQHRIAKLMEKSGNAAGGRKAFEQGLEYWRKNRDKVKDRGLPIAAEGALRELEPALELYANKAAVVAAQMAPAAMLLGGAIATSGLRQTREWTAFRSVGLGPWRVALPMVAAALLSAVLMGGLHDLVGVHAAQRAEEISANRFARGGSTRRWLAWGSTRRPATWRARRFGSASSIPRSGRPPPRPPRMAR